VYELGSPHRGPLDVSGFTAEETERPIGSLPHLGSVRLLLLSDNVR
jgi:hypothetical protein